VCSFDLEEVLQKIVSLGSQTKGTATQIKRLDRMAILHEVGIEFVVSILALSSKGQ
jgi:hypothetical protein